MLVSGHLILDILVYSVEVEALINFEVALKKIVMIVESLELFAILFSSCVNNRKFLKAGDIYYIVVA